MEFEYFEDYVNFRIKEIFQDISENNLSNNSDIVLNTNVLLNEFRILKNGNINSNYKIKDQHI